MASFLSSFLPSCLPSLLFLLQLSSSSAGKISLYSCPGETLRTGRLVPWAHLLQLTLKLPCKLSFRNIDVLTWFPSDTASASLQPSEGDPNPSCDLNSGLSLNLVLPIFPTLLSHLSNGEYHNNSLLELLSGFN